jgi:putative membrane protein
MTDQKNYTPLIWALSIGINLLIALAFFLPKISLPAGYDFSYIPVLNASLNSGTFLSLLAAFIAIKKKKIILHKRFIFTALTFTAIFLGSYLLYHFTVPATKFGGEGFIRIVYFFILITHIILAALIVPFALITIARGLNMQVARHRKIARWVMPVWLYVSLTGVLIFILISPYYIH